MSFRDNLQHLRAERNMTQEQLAMLLGVSRQSVTKWESEKSQPEMDKLLKMCEIFDCTLDELVTGDLTGRAAPATAAPIPAGPPADVCGYDEHWRMMALKVPPASPSSFWASRSAFSLRARSSWRPGTGATASS